MRRRSLSLMLILSLLFSSACLPSGTAAADGGTIDFFTLNDPGYVDIHSTYSDVGFIWNDNMLLEDSRKLSTDIAKASVGLSVLAYDNYYLCKVLGNSQDDANEPGMGFTVLGDDSSYKARTFEDNDHVAFRIARKTIKDSAGKKYTVYCVPIRGTMGAEWFSDFRLGRGSENSGRHLGFYLAATEVLSALRDLMYADKASASTRIIWLTGHSRGAAVSNIVAAALMQEGLASSSHCFSYNFACPAVAKSVNTSATNIINFINTGDVVPTVPLESWGYKRNGQDIKKQLSGMSVIYDQIVREEGSPFEGLDGTGGFTGLMSWLLPTEEKYYDPMIQYGVLLLSNGLGGSTEANQDSVKAKKRELLAAAGMELVANRIETFGSDFRAKAYELISYLNETLDLVHDFWNDILDLTSEEDKLSRFSSSLRNRLEEFWNGTISTLQDITGASAKIDEAKALTKSSLDLAGAFLQLYFDLNGNPLNGLRQGHDQKTYMYWINADYYGYKGHYQDDRVVSKTIDKANNSEIRTIGAYCFSGCENFTAVNLAGSVRYIGGFSFGKTGLSGTLELPEGLQAIGRDAFSECAGITAIHLPRSIQWIGIGAFGCANATEVTIPVELPAADAFSVPKVNTIHYIVGSTGIMPDRSGSPSMDRTWTLEESCRTNLTTVTFEDGILHIGASAFEAVQGQNLVEGVLTDVMLPATLQSIGADAFRFQDHLTELELPDSLVEIGEYCFQRTGLESMVIPEGVKAIPVYCFHECSQLRSVELPEGIRTIGTSAFEGCEALEALLLPHTVEEIGQDAFVRTTALKEFSIPVELCDENLLWVRSIGPVEKLHYLFGSTGVMPDRSQNLLNNRALEQSLTDSLREVDFEEGITRIGDYALTCWGSYGVGSASGSLQKVTLPSTLKSIGVSAFNGRTDLREIVLPEGLEELGDACFKSTGLTEIMIPSTVRTVGRECFYYCRSLGRISFLGDAPVFTRDEVFMENVAEIVWPAEKSGWSANIKALSSTALFCHSDAEPVLQIAGNIRTLEESAFENIGVTIIELESGVQAIGADTFRSDRDLLIRVPASVTQIDENAFRSSGRVFIAAPQDSTAWQFAAENGIRLITTNKN